MGKARGLSGGGIETKKLVNVGVKAGSRTTQKISPGAVSNIGIQQVATAGAFKLVSGEAQAASRLGNDLAGNVGKGGPGAGRTVQPCGTQGIHNGPSPTKV